MDYLKVRTRFEMATTVAVLLASIVILSGFATSFFVNSRDNVRLSDGLKRGLVISPLPKIDYSSASQTLLIFMSTKCGSCTESIPFYQQLKTVQDKAVDIKVVAVFPNQENEVNQYIHRNSLNIETINEIDPNLINVVTTPTIILIDKSGRVTDFWIGKLSKENEQEVMNAMGL